MLMGCCVAVSAHRCVVAHNMAAPTQQSPACGARQGDGPPSAGEPARAPVEGGKATAEEVGHRDLVFLDYCATGHLITHTLTHERVRLPSGDWQLDFDEDDIGVLVDVRDARPGAEPRILHVADLLQRTVFRAATSGELFVQKDASVKAVSLDMERCWFRDATVDLICGRTSAKVGMRCFIMKMSRHGKQCMFWPLVLLYGVLQLSSFKKQGGRWVQHEMTRWTKWLADNLGDSQIVRGRQARLGDDRKDLGGFGERASRQAASELFEGFLRYFLSKVGAQSCLEVCADDDWVCTFPRPQPVCVEKVPIYVSGECINLRGLDSFGGGPRAASTCKRWRRALGKLFSGAEVAGRQDILLIAFITACISVSAVRSLLVQLLWLVSLKVEVVCAQQVKSEGGSGTDSLTVQWTKEDILMDEATDSKLGALILCSVATTAGCYDFSLATDKASVAGFPLVNSCLALPSGEAFVCAPQACVVATLCARLAPGEGWYKAPAGALRTDLRLPVGPDSDAASPGAGSVSEPSLGGGGGSFSVWLCGQTLPPPPPPGGADCPERGPRGGLSELGGRAVVPPCTPRGMWCQPRPLSLPSPRLTEASTRHCASRGPTA